MFRGWPKNFLLTRVSKLRKVSTCEELFKGTGAVIATIGGWPIDTEAFNPYRKEILQQLTLRPEFQASADAFLHKITADVYDKFIYKDYKLDFDDYEWDGDSIVFVGIHIRRTDYKKHIHKQLGGSSLVTKMYFDTAMAFFKEKYRNSRVIFVLATDDEEWSRRMFQEHSDVVFASSGHRKVVFCVNTLYQIAAI